MTLKRPIKWDGQWDRVATGAEEGGRGLASWSPRPAGAWRVGRSPTATSRPVTYAEPGVVVSLWRPECCRGE